MNLGRERRKNEEQITPRTVDDEDDHVKVNNHHCGVSKSDTASPHTDPTQVLPISVLPDNVVITMSSDTDASLDKTVLAVSFASAVLYLFQVRSSPSYSRTLVKTSSTALLSYLSHLLGGPQFLTGALALSSLGDAFLAWDGDLASLCGLSSFLVAHVLYILLFLQPQHAAGFQNLLMARWRTATAGGLALLVPVMIATLMPKVGNPFRVPVMVYSLTICVMALTALTLENGRVIVGTTMFTASDSILAADKFLVPETTGYRGWMRRAAWVLYYGGQALITLGFVEPAW